jgi:hypothetical protein
MRKMMKIIVESGKDREKKEIKLKSVFLIESVKKKKKKTS